MMGKVCKSARMTHSLKSRKTYLDCCGFEINRKSNSAWIVPQGRTLGCRVSQGS